MPGPGATASSTVTLTPRARAWSGKLKKGTGFANGAFGNITGGRSDLERLIGLFTHEDTAELLERQLVVLQRVCKLRQNGFRYAELALVGQLIPLVERKVLSGLATEFRAPLLKLLDICSLTPVRDRANEELTQRGLSAASSLFCVLGETLWSLDGSVQSGSAEVLRKIAAGNDPRRPNILEDGGNARLGETEQDLRPKTRDINQALLLGCGVVASAVACLGTVIDSVVESLAGLHDMSTQSSSFGGSEERGADETCALGVRNSIAEGTPEDEGSACRDLEVKCVQQRSEDAATGGDGATYETQIRIDDDEATIASNIALTCTVLVSMLQFVRELSTDAESSAAMVEAGVVSRLVRVLRVVRGVRDPALSITVEVMWNCLEHSLNAMKDGPAAKSRTSLIHKARKSNAAFALSTWDGVYTLREIVQDLLVHGFRKKDKELRNEVIIVASQLTSNKRSHALFRQTGMLSVLLRYATAIETGLADGDPRAVESEAKALAVARGELSGAAGGRHNAERREVPELGPLADPRNFATIAEVDMELRLLLWSLLADLCKTDSHNLDVIEASPLIETLLMHMDLVVEEGQSADPTLPGMSRSISLASMPPVRSDQTVPVVARYDHISSAAAESDLRTPGPTSGSDGNPLSTTPPSEGLQSLGDQEQEDSCYGQMNGSGAEETLRSGQHTEGSLPAEIAHTEGQNAPASGPTAPQNLSFTQLYVPATLIRLPITSIQLLQGQAMGSLMVLAPRCPKKFQALGGHMVTLRLLHRLGTRPENQSLVKVATKLLAAVVGLPGLKEELGRVDGVRIMIDRFSAECKRESNAGGSAAEGGAVGGGEGNGTSGGSHRKSCGDLRTDTVIILCRLCEGCPENQEAFRKADGVPIFMTAVKAYCRARSEAGQLEGGSPNSDGSGGAGTKRPASTQIGSGDSQEESGIVGGSSLDPSLVHIIDCLWSAIVGNRRSEARLLQCEGLDTLLDLLELCPVFMRHQVTGVVADLLRNKRSIPYARAWRSDLNMLSVTQLMVRLWVAEEARLGVSRPNGVLQNLWQPLQSHDPKVGQSEGFVAVQARLAPARGTRPSPASRISASGTTSNEGEVSTTHAGIVETIVPDSATRNSETAQRDTHVEERHDERGEGGEDEDARIMVEACPPQPPHAVERAFQIRKRAPGGKGRGPGCISERGKSSSQADVETSIAKAVKYLDLRGKIAAVLGMVGFDGSTTDGLGLNDLKASYMAMSYMNFREGEAWQEVAGELEAQQANPITADALVLDTMLERAFDCAQEVKSRQMALTAKQGQREGETEAAFFADILFQRDQEFRQAIIKRNALIPGVSKKRIAAKKAKGAVAGEGANTSRRESGDTLNSSGHLPPSEDTDEE